MYVDMSHYRSNLLVTVNHVLIFRSGKSIAPMHAQQVVKPLPIQAHAVRVADYCA
ncbi:hypothetical protein [Acinetobacter pragensis]|uniref:hypothetical protein n=1 Tax=Acinetobacter pragensis TaxID=1806892 RepID=UPI003341F264